MTKKAKLITFRKKYNKAKQKKTGYKGIVGACQFCDQQKNPNDPTKTLKKERSAGWDSITTCCEYHGKNPPDGWD